MGGKKDQMKRRLGKSLKRAEGRTVTGRINSKNLRVEGCGGLVVRREEGLQEEDVR